MLSFLLQSHSLVSAPFFFFFNDTATTEIYTLSLHDALPISHAARPSSSARRSSSNSESPCSRAWSRRDRQDRKSTRLNSSHGYISYAVFCLKKKKKKTNEIIVISNKASRTRLQTTTRARQSR